MIVIFQNIAFQILDFSFFGNDHSKSQINKTMASATAETKDTNSCAYCGTHENNDTKLKTCNACKMVRYCSRYCQVSHWPQHQEACKKHTELFEQKLFKDPPEREECPICMLPFPFYEKNSSVFFPCCGTVVCKGCVHAQFKEDVNNGKEREDCHSCAFCRMPATRNEKERIHRLNRCVERNHAPSINRLAMIYMYGLEGVEKDMAKAMKLFEKSGKLGYAEAYFWLGNIYREERYGIERDMKRARYYYELGAIGGSIISRCNLGALDVREGYFTRACKHYLICAKAGADKSLEPLKFGCKLGFVSKDEYAEALRAYQKQRQDTRSDMREEASRFEQQQRSMNEETTYASKSDA